MGLFDLTLIQRERIRASPERVWEAFAKIESWPEWNSVCERVEVLGGEPWQPGFRFRMVLRMAGAKIPFRPMVVECSAASRVLWTSTTFTITGTRTFTFRLGNDGATEVVDEKRFTSRVLPVRLFYPRPVISAMSREWLRSLKAEVERRVVG